MDKYMLISIEGQDFNFPKFYNNHNKAHNQMCKEVADIMGMTWEEVMETYLEGIEIDNYSCVTENTAWCERHQNYQWEIFHIRESDLA